MKEKLEFSPSEIDIIEVYRADIITTSGGEGTNNNPENEDSSGWV